MSVSPLSTASVYQNGLWQIGHKNATVKHLDASQHTQCVLIDQYKGQQQAWSRGEDLNVSCVKSAWRIGRTTIPSGRYELEGVSITITTPADLSDSTTTADLQHRGSGARVEDLPFPNNTGLYVFIAHEEHQLLSFFQDLAGRSTMVHITMATLSHGDIAIVLDGHLVQLIERKTTRDLLQSIHSHHWQKQRQRLMQLPLYRNILPRGSGGRITLLVENNTLAIDRLSSSEMATLISCEHRTTIRDRMQVHQTTGILGTVLYIYARVKAIIEVGPGDLVTVIKHASGATVVVPENRLGSASVETSETHTVSPPIVTATPIVPVKIPNQFNIPRQVCFPPAYFLANVLGLARHSSFHRGLGVISEMKSIRQMIHYFDTKGHNSDRVQALASIPFLSKTDMESLQCNTSFTHPPEEQEVAKKRKRVNKVGTRVATSILYSLGYSVDVESPRGNKKRKGGTQNTPG